jgi:hypothetical protein
VDPAIAKAPSTATAPLLWMKVVPKEQVQRVVLAALERGAGTPEEQRWLAATEQQHQELDESSLLHRETSVVSFSLLGDEKKHLRINPHFGVDFEAGPGPWGYFYATPTSAGTVLRALSHTTIPAYLAPTIPPAVQTPQTLPAPQAYFASSRGGANAATFLPAPATVFEWGIVGPDGRTPQNLVNGVAIRFYHLLTGFLAPGVFRAEVVNDDAMGQLFAAMPGAANANKNGGWRGATGLSDVPATGNQRTGFFRFMLNGVSPVAARLGNAPPAALAPVGGGGRLRIPHQDDVDVNGGGGPWATWRVDVALSDSSPPVYSLQTVGHLCSGDRAFLAHAPSQANATGFSAYRCRSTSGGASHSDRLTDRDWHGLPKFVFEVLSESHPEVQRCLVGDANSRLYYDEAAALSVLPRDKLASFYENGFVTLDRAVARRIVDEARHYVNNLMGKGPSAWEEDPDAGREDNGAIKYKLKHGNHHTLLATVYQSAVSSAIQKLMGGQGSAMAVGGAQLAIRFPVDASVPAVRPTAVAGGSINRDSSEYDKPAPIDVKHCGQAGWHIDGMGRDKHLPFGLLVLIALSDQNEDGHGNFTVWPGMHRDPAVRSWYHSGVGTRGAGNDLTEQQRHAFSLFAQRKPALTRGPLQVHMKAGDVALVHPLLPHSVGINMSPDPRYTIIMRFQAAHQAEHDEASRIDPQYDTFPPRLPINAPREPTAPRWSHQFVLRTSC